MKDNYILQTLKSYQKLLSKHCEVLDSKRKIPGVLRISKSKKQVVYRYFRFETESKGQYLKKTDLLFIKALAQQEYEEDYSKALKEVIQAISKCEKILEKCKDPDEVYENLRDERKALVKASSPDDEYAATWLKKHKAPPSFFNENAPVIMTADGLRVRSKSEFMYATVFKARGIPFVFETKVITNVTVRRPDFLVLNKRTKKEYYIEHFGMMGDPGYLASTLEKLKEYSEIGIVLGDNLLASFETTDHPLDIEDINRLVDRFLI